MNGAKNRDIDE